MTRTPLLSACSANSIIRIAFFDGQAHRRQQADLQIDVVLQSAQGHRENRADQAERDDQQHRDRDRPAFVQRGEAQEHDQQRDRVEQRRLARRQPLLIGLARPRRCWCPGICVGQLLDLVHRLARADARRRLALEFERGHALEARQAARRRRPAGSREGGERRHLAGRRADVPLRQALRVGAVRRVALDIDALDAALVDEVVDVAPAPGGRQRVLTSFWLRPERASASAGRRRSCSVATSGRSLKRTAVSFGSALARSSSWSRAAMNCSRLMPLRFCSSMVKPFDWPRPRIAPGTSANTCASRRPRNAPDARWTMASAVFSLPGRLLPVDEIDEALAGVLAAGAAAAAAAGDREQASRRSWLRARRNIFRSAAWTSMRAVLGRARRQAELDLRRALVLGRQEARRQPQEHDDQRQADQRRKCRANSHLRSITSDDRSRGSGSTRRSKPLLNQLLARWIGVADRRRAAIEPAGPVVPLVAAAGAAAVEVSAGLKISATSTDSTIAETMVSENCL